MKSKLIEAIANPTGERIITKHDLTVEEIVAIEEYRKQGKVHPLENMYPSPTELRAQVGRYGLRAEEYMIYHNFKKWLNLRVQGTLEEELIALEIRIEAFKEQRAEAYRQPKNAPLQEKVLHRSMYQSETEELIFKELIVPFAMD